MIIKRYSPKKLNEILKKNWQTSVTFKYFGYLLEHTFSAVWRILILIIPIILIIMIIAIG